MTALTLAIDIDGTTSQLSPRELLFSSIEMGEPIPVTEPIVKSVLLGLPTVPGARDVINKLNKHFTVDLVTNRPEFFHEITAEWADRKQLQFRNLRCVGMDCRKGELSDVDVVIDDSPHNVMSGAENADAGILFNGRTADPDLLPDHPDVYVADAWADVPRVLNTVYPSQCLGATPNTRSVQTRSVAGHSFLSY